MILSKNKNLFINIVAQIIAFGISTGTAFLLTPFLVNTLGKEIYGFVSLGNDFVNYALVLTVALNSMAARFITISISQGKHLNANKYYTSIFISNIVISLFLGIPFALVVIYLDHILNISSTFIFDVRILWTLIFLNFLISIVSSIFGVATFSKNKLYLTSMVSVESNLLKTLILLTSFLFLFPHVWYIGIAGLASTIYVMVRNIRYSHKLLPEIKIKKEYFDFSTLKEVISAGVWNSFTKMSVIFSNGLSLLLSNIFISEGAMGILSITRTIPTFILTAFSTLASAFLPQLTIDYAQNKKEDIENYLFKSIKILGFFASIPMAFLFAYGREFYKLWMPTQDPNILYLLTIFACFGYIALLPVESLWGIFTVTNKVKMASIYLFIESIITLIITMIVLSVSKDENIKIYGLVLVNTIMFTIRSLTFLPIYGAYALKLHRFSFYKPIFKNILATILVTVFSMFIKYFFNITSWGKLLCAGLATFIGAIMINTFFLLTKQDRKHYLNILIEKIKKNT